MRTVYLQWQTCEWWQSQHAHKASSFAVECEEIRDNGKINFVGFRATAAMLGLEVGASLLVTIRLLPWPNAAESEAVLHVPSIGLCGSGSRPVNREASREYLPQNKTTRPHSN
ncbi:hypothetical protein MRX96_022084 [Rhipicephalus microplus]